MISLTKSNKYEGQSDIDFAIRALGDLCRRYGIYLEDVESEAFFAIKAAERTFKPEKGASFRSHIYSKLRYVPINRALGRTGIKLGEDKLFREELHLNGNRTTERRTINMVAAREALAGMSCRNAEVLRLYYESGYTYTEIGSMFGVTHEAIRLWRNEAIKKLKEAL